MPLYDVIIESETRYRVEAVDETDAEEQVLPQIANLSSDIPRLNTLATKKLADWLQDAWTREVHVREIS